MHEHKPSQGRRIERGRAPRATVHAVALALVLAPVVWAASAPVADDVSVTVVEGTTADITLTYTVALPLVLAPVRRADSALVADDVTVTVVEGTTADITLTAHGDQRCELSWTDPEHPIVYTSPIVGTLGQITDQTCSPNPNTDTATIEYTTGANGGTDRFQYRVWDPEHQGKWSNVATVSIAITPVNDAPVALSQSVSAVENTPQFITLTASDEEGDELTFTVTSGPAHGVLSGIAPYVLYTPATDYTGSDSFAFVASDGLLESAPATVSITVAPRGHPPIVSPQAVTTTEDAAASITLTGSDEDGDSLTFRVSSGPYHGAVSGTPPNVTYTPALNFWGYDSFDFVANDGKGDSAPATVSITVVAAPDPPVATAQSVVTAEDTPKGIALSGYDPDGDTLTFAVVTAPSHGTLSGVAPALTYTPSADYSGADSFTFTAFDGIYTSEAAVISISVTPVNDAPIANPQTVRTPQDTAVGITLTGSDADGDGLTYSVVSGPSHGTLSGTAPSLTYTPASGYSGADSFTFRVNDGVLDSAPATVSIAVGLVTYQLPFRDDFESGRGWVEDPGGTDSATGGWWERANPEGTDSSGPKQLGDASSGLMDLVTGPLAGHNAETHDVDGGVTSVRSPFIELPPSGDVTLAFAYYFAHGRDSSADDFLRVKVVGDSTVTMLNVPGSNSDVDAAWTTFSASLSAFAGQTVYLVVEAADMATASLVEAAVDDVSITATSPTTLLSASFTTGAEGFVYADDTFRGTLNPDYAGGAYVPAGGFSGGGVQVSLGNLDNALVNGMSGGWSKGFTAPGDKAVRLSFLYKLTMASDYESGQYGEVLVSVGDGAPDPLYGQPPNDYVARLVGNGIGGQYETTGWRLVSLDLGTLAAGTYTLTLGGYNSQKGWQTDTTEVLIDSVLVTCE